jgi:hypothetical protein
MSKEKVYCRDCKWYEQINLPSVFSQRLRCNVPINIKVNPNNWHSPTKRWLKKPYRKNKHNDCKDFEKK